MANKKQESLRQRLERVWTKRRPNPDDQTEFTAEGKKTRTPTQDEFFGNLEKASEPEPPHSDQSGE